MFSLCQTCCLSQMYWCLFVLFECVLKSPFDFTQCIYIDVVVFTVSVYTVAIAGVVVVFHLLLLLFVTLALFFPLFASFWLIRFDRCCVCTNRCKQSFAHIKIISCELVLFSFVLCIIVGFYYCLNV